MDLVCRALSDPTRRWILDVLRRAGPLSLSSIARPLRMSRQGVTKHLDALERAGLVRVERRGRERLHSLAAEPLDELSAWLEPYVSRVEARELDAGG